MKNSFKTIGKLSWVTLIFALVACSGDFENEDGIALTEPESPESMLLPGGAFQCNQDLWELAKKYAPFIYFHSNESFYASSINFALANSHLRHNWYSNLKWYVNEYDIDKQSYNGRNSGDHNVFHLNINNDAYGGSKHSFEVYVHIYRRTSYATEITYWFYFPYDGGVAGIGSHESDWEHVTVSVNALCNLEGVYYSAHRQGDGAGWVGRGGIEFWGNHPIIYCAKRSHGFWPKKGTFGLDKTNRGFGIDTTPALVLGEDEVNGIPSTVAPWLNYEGKWGKDPNSPRGPWKDDTWRLDPVPPTFGCNDSSCPPGYTCSFAGDCVVDPNQGCAATGCPFGYVCISGQCVAQ